VRNHWTRELGEVIAKLSRSAQKSLMPVVMDFPPEIRRGVITAYVIASIKATTSPEEIPTFLNLAQEVGILTKGRPVKDLPFYRTNEATYIPANPDAENPDRQAAAIIIAARHQNTFLRHSSE